MNYTTTEKKFFTVVFTLKKLDPYLLGTKITIFINHFALRYLMLKKDARPDSFVGLFSFKSLILKFEIKRVLKMSSPTTSLVSEIHLPTSCQSMTISPMNKFRNL